MNGSYPMLRKTFKGFDRRSLITQLINRYGWNRRQASRATLRYLMFLFIAGLYPQFTIVPTVEIDQVWELHFLTNTEQYMRDCTLRFGYVIHHANLADMAQFSERPTPDLAFAQTLALVEHHFGPSAWDATLPSPSNATFSNATVMAQLPQSRPSTAPAPCGRPALR